MEGGGGGGGLKGIEVRNITLYPTQENVPVLASFFFFSPSVLVLIFFLLQEQMSNLTMLLANEKKESIILFIDFRRYYLEASLWELRYVFMIAV